MTLTPKTNIIERSDYYKRAIALLDVYIDLLKRHCGPFALNAAIPQTIVAGKVQHLFTKDGINIVDTTQSTDAVSECIRQAISYIGSRIDAVCHDGTTTGMLFSCILLKNSINEILNKGFTNIDIKQTTIALKKILNNLISVFEEKKKTIEDYQNDQSLPSYIQARRQVAFYQAMISSKGDRQLSEIIAKVAETSPIEDLYGMFIFDHSHYESDRGFEIIDRDEDLGFTIFYDNRLNNTKFNTELVIKGANIFASNNDFIEGNPDYHQFVEMFNSKLNSIKNIADDYQRYLAIVNSHDNYFFSERPLVIIAEQISGDIHCNVQLYNSIVKYAYNNLYQKRERYPNINFDVESLPYIYLLNVSDKVPECGIQYVDLIPVLRNLDPRHERFVTDVDIHVKNNFITLKNLYEKTNSIYHPYYSTEESPYQNYERFRQEVKSFLEMAYNTHNHTKINSETVRHLTLMYRYLISQKWATIKINGSTHDIRQYESIIVDTYGALVSSFKHGFIYSWIHILNNDLGCTIKDHSYYDLNKNFIKKALDEITETIYGSLLTEEYREEPSIIVYDTEEGKYKIEHSDGRLIQPVKGVTEMLKRISEVIIPFIETGTYIEPDIKIQ